MQVLAPNALICELSGSNSSGDSGTIAVQNAVGSVTSGSLVSWQTSDDCSGKSEGQKCSSGGVFFLGEYRVDNSGAPPYRYMTPVLCDRLSICSVFGGGGGTRVSRTWDNRSSGWVDIDRIINLTVPQVNSFIYDQNSGTANSHWLSNHSLNTFEAAKHCENLSHGGYNDWYLPNISELNEIDIALDSAEKNSMGFDETAYWSSSEETFTKGLAYQFYLNGSGGPFAAQKNQSYVVRCVRRY
ncbi:MAG: DUF1566 domain-containing protein [Bdellovibrionia bacterium]